jgi:hypothetical protein
MPEVQVTGTVQVITPNTSYMEAVFGGQLNVTSGDPSGPFDRRIRIDYNVPSFSSIFTLLMASAVNNKPISVDMIINEPGMQQGVGTIQWVRLIFF